MVVDLSIGHMEAWLLPEASWSKERGWRMLSWYILSGASSLGRIWHKVDGWMWLSVGGLGHLCRQVLRSYPCHHISAVNISPNIAL